MVIKQCSCVAYQCCEGCYQFWNDLWISCHLCLRVDAKTGFTQANFHHIVTDHLGAPILATDKQGSKSWRSYSEAFGNTGIEAGAGTQINLRFPGQYYDAETGLHQNYFRDYSPALGRYVQSDPIGVWGGLNIYGYANNSPMRFIDPDGLSPLFLACNPNCWRDCLRDDPWFRYFALFSLLPVVNLKTPKEIVQPGVSWFTSIDRRLPRWTGASMEKGVTVIRGTIKRTKYIGLYASWVAGFAGFFTVYSRTAMIRCYIECRE